MYLKVAARAGRVQLLHTAPMMNTASTNTVQRESSPPLAEQYPMFMSKDSPPPAAPVLTVGVSKVREGALDLLADPATLLWRRIASLND